ncbi:Plant self-incompatibility protein S1 family [Abeliophyllum distichum]|uniref:S-protein homolog n=1 Tax=Abeliophyllum distichum TaxID=126358 RepID=A0ABD1URC0_9LAMI
MVLLLIKLAFSLALLLNLTQSHAKTTVIIENFIKNDEILIRCESEDNNFGSHVLKFGEKFSWRFKPDLFGGTKFYCYFQSGFGAGDYGVYTRNIKSRCGEYCEWQIQKTGPCLVQTSKGNSLFCQPWKLPVGNSLASQRLPKIPKEH